MAKKYKSTKLIKPSAAIQQKPASAFGKHANRLADARKKKIQKLTDTQKRVLQSRKNNKMIKISKKAKKFALLDQQGDHDQQVLKKMSLTHKGVSIKDMKRFDDVNLGESDLENDEEFDDFQEKMHFAGFQATDNLLQEQNDGQKDDKREKSKNEVYKEIIEKSKAYKMLRQEQYEENFNLANQLDEGFDELVGQLKFRNKDQQMLQRLQHRDLEYDKLMNQLKDDQRVVSNKIVEKNEKLTEKIRKRKNDQLNKLMKDSSDEQDIRGWVDEEAEDEDEENSEEISGEDGEQQASGSEEQQEEYDELDDVQLSSEQQQQGDDQAQQGDKQEQQQGQEEQQGVEVDNQSQQEAQLEDDEDQEQQQDSDQQQQDEDQQQQQEEQSESYEQPVFTKNSNNNKKQQQQQQPSRQNPQKKRKLNFVE